MMKVRTGMISRPGRDNWVSKVDFVMRLSFLIVAILAIVQSRCSPG